MGDGRRRLAMFSNVLGKLPLRGYPAALSEPHGHSLGSSDTDARILVYGTTWCGACRLAKRVLGEAGQDYEWIDIDEIPGAAALVVELNAGFRSVPTIVFPDGRV